MLFFSCRAVLGEIDSAKAGLWSTFIKPTRFTVYKEQIPDPSNSFNQYISAGTDFHVTNQMEVCTHDQKDYVMLGIFISGLFGIIRLSNVSDVKSMSEVPLCSRGNEYNRHFDPF